MNAPNFNIINRELYKLNLAKCVKNLKTPHFLISETSKNIYERLQEFSIHFNSVLIYGLYDENYLPNKTQCIHRGFLTSNLPTKQKNYLIFDEEYNTCSKDEYDLIISNLSLHMANDVPGALIQYKKSLAPEGVFIATMFGTETLKELKESFLKTDCYFYNGVSPRVMPFIDIKDAAALLKRAGFNQAIADSYYVKVRYSSLKKLFDDIKGIGQSNCLMDRKKCIPPKNYFSRLEEYYQKEHNLEATFEVVTMTSF